MNSPDAEPARLHEPKSAVEMRTISEDEAGQRIDNFLMRHFKTVPRSRVYRLLRRGEVRVNRKRVDAEYRLAAGDELRLPPVRIDEAGEPGRPSTSLLELIERAIIFQDKHVLVLDKPAGVAVHGGSGMSFGVIEALRASRPRETLELVHRLDRDTSGVLMIARDRQTLVALHALIRNGGMHKTYLALVAGSWQLGTKRIDAPLATENRQHGERHVRVAQSGKDSVSIFKPVQFFGSLATLMEVDIPTGRTHQIRVHASFAGHPLLGDDKYGDYERNAELKGHGLKRTFLHAQSVAFDWPSTGVPFHVSAPLPPELSSLIDEITPMKRKAPKGVPPPRARAARAKPKSARAAEPRVGARPSAVHAARPAGMGRPPARGVERAGRDERPDREDRPVRATEQPARGDRPMRFAEQRAPGDRPVRAAEQPARGGRPMRGADQPARGDRPVRGAQRPGRENRPQRGANRPGRDGGRPAHAERPRSPVTAARPPDRETPRREAVGARGNGGGGRRNARGSARPSGRPASSSGRGPRPSGRNSRSRG